MPTKLIILDRDGVINQDSPDYIKSAAEWHPIAGSIEAIARLHRGGYRVVVATNQSGLGRGLFDLEMLDAMHNKLRDKVEQAGGMVDGVYYCPHRPEDQCQCRKPATGMLDAIARDFSTPILGVPLVGDSLKDLQLAIAAGCRPFLVRTGKGEITEERLPTLPDFALVTVLPDLAAVADLLVGARAVTLP